MMTALRSTRSLMRPISAFRIMRTSITCTTLSQGRLHHLETKSVKLTLIRSLSSKVPLDNDERPPPPQKRGFIGGALFAGSLLFGKTKYLFAALKVTKMAPLASMLITSATYSLFFGWPYAIGTCFFRFGFDLMSDHVMMID